MKSVITSAVAPFPVSDAALNRNVSALARPVMVSRPPPPTIVSLPANPFSVSAPAAPVTTLSNTLPVPVKAPAPMKARFSKLLPSV